MTQTAPLTNRLQPPSAEAVAAVDAAITTRRSVRAYLDRPVPRETLEAILSVASRS
ncbi:MAG TPA: nitroreductase family protein, partial [Burkholderiaceae bacterium]|nr:nitroreductase family protein [Burkholderiaceae bacterium]